LNLLRYFKFSKDAFNKQANKNFDCVNFVLLRKEAAKTSDKRQTKIKNPPLTDCRLFSHFFIVFTGR